MQYREILEISGFNSYEVAKYIAFMAGFPRGSRCWEFSKVLAEYNKEIGCPELSGVSVWHRDTVTKCSGQSNRHDVGYIIETKPDIIVNTIGENVYEVLFSEKIPRGCVGIFSEVESHLL